ncbi:hypothetical protein COLO4_15686 [Corchorus olitorius]|uniref:Uncharacterized protein n=1 Tax=Corchorus olitorius TaxID=93759 RepID=A0A1R3JLM3_9ROSI|nr:hypothetical protein COLO4_15686 [Corchorus olitorius]
MVEANQGREHRWEKQLAAIDLVNTVPNPVTSSDPLWDAPNNEFVLMERNFHVFTGKKGTFKFLEPNDWSFPTNLQLSVDAGVAVLSKLMATIALVVVDGFLKVSPEGESKD